MPSSPGPGSAQPPLAEIGGPPAMSQENVAVVRAIHEALARGESPATLGLLHPDIEYVNPAGAVEPGTRRGIAAYEDALRSMHEAFEDVRIEVREIIDAGDQVVVLATYTARGRGSGAQRQHEGGTYGPFGTGRLSASSGSISRPTPSKPQGYERAASFRPEARARR